MMFKFFVSLFVLVLSASLYAQSNLSVTGKDLADEITIVIDQIINDENAYEKLENKINHLDEKINKNQKALNEMNGKKAILENELMIITENQKKIESNLLTLTVKKYSKSIAIKRTEKKSPKSIIDNEVHLILRKSIKNEVVNYNKNSANLKENISSKLNLITELTNVKKEQEILISSYLKLQSKQIEMIKELRKKHSYYISKLEELNKSGSKELSKSYSKRPLKYGSINKINSQNETIKNLNEKKSLLNNLKTVSPLSDYTIISKYGKYYDEEFKSELFHKSISLKPKKAKMKVHNMLEGKIHLLKKDTDYSKNIIIVKHSNNLKSIYSNLDLISSNIFKGKRIVQGTVLGHVNDKLILEVTYNNKYINPEKLLK